MKMLPWLLYRTGVGLSPVAMFVLISLCIGGAFAAEEPQESPGPPSQCTISAIGKCECLTYDYSGSGLYTGVEEGVIRLRGYHSNEDGQGKPGDYVLEVPQAPEVLLPLLTIRTAGKYASVEERTAHVTERIGVAFDMLEQDSANSLFLRTDEDGEGIWVSCVGFKHDFRIMTISKEDAARMPRTMSAVLQTSSEVAEYVKSILEAYHKLFLTYKLPEGTEILTGTREGTILKRIYLDALEHAERIGGRKAIKKVDIVESINMLDRDQRLRLYGLPLRVPWDWRQSP
jgi:hypothetical protein